MMAGEAGWSGPVSDVAARSLKAVMVLAAAPGHSERR